MTTPDERQLDFIDWTVIILGFIGCISIGALIIKDNLESSKREKEWANQVHNDQLVDAELRVEENMLNYLYFYRQQERERKQEIWL